MRFNSVGELTAYMTPAGDIALHAAHRARQPQRWTGVSRTVRVRTTFEGGSATLEVFRGEVILRGMSDGGGRSLTSFLGHDRYLAAQSALRVLRRDAGRWVESERQLARIAR